MELPDALKGKTETEIEEWLLNALAATPLPAAPMIAVLEHLHASGRRDQVADWCELMLDVLCEAGDIGGTLALLAARCGWVADGPGAGGYCRDALARVLKSSEDVSFLESAGFGEAPAAECLRRVGVLMRLAPGVMCLSKAWGFGVVRELDGFYRRVTVDFDDKPRHRLSFAHAAESLDLIAEDHLLARRHRDPDGLAKMIAEDPGEVVRVVLAGYGDMNVPRLQELLTSTVLPEEGWKSFWDGARKSLKQDPLVEVPAKRNDPLRLLSSEKTYGADWLAALAGERDPDRILSHLHELARELGAGKIEDAHRCAAGERLAFVVRAAGVGDTPWVARVLVLADCLEIVPGTAAEQALDTAAVMDRVLDPDAFVRAVGALPAREVPLLLAHLNRRAPERAALLLLDVLPRLPLGVLVEVNELLAGCGRETERDTRIAAAMEERRAGAALLCLLCRDPLGWVKRGVAALPELLVQAVDVLELPMAGDALRAQNQLRLYFQEVDWLALVLADLDSHQREALLRRVRRSRGWDTASLRSVMGHIIKLYPDLAGVVTDRETPREGSKGEKRITSWRSYRERQEQLRRLVEEAIPENSREIAVARSYGDLRENAEYKFAKEHQSILLRRQAELEEDLRRVVGADFADAPADVAGPGVCVAIRRADGRAERFHILGEWDRDEDLGIVSNRSRLAEALAGRRVGDRVQVPSGGDPEECTIEGISPPDEAVRQWLQAKPAPQAEC